MALQNTGLGFPVVATGSPIVASLVNAVGEKIFLRGLVICNYDVTSRNVKAHHVPNSSGSPGTAANGNLFFSTDLLPGESVVFEVPFSIVLTDEGDSIQVVASAADVVNVLFCGDLDS